MVEESRSGLSRLTGKAPDPGFTKLFHDMGSDVAAFLFEEGLRLRLRFDRSLLRQFA